MSAALQTRAEIVKLARLLGVRAGELEFLRPAAAEDLAQVRDQLTESMFSGGSAALNRLAAASKLLPGPVSATIAQRAIGPVLCARLAGMVDPSKAVETARHLPASFLADVAIQIDPRRARDVIARVPAALVGAVAGELDRRGEYVTMGRFVAYVSDEAIKAALSEVSDGGLLQIAFVLEGKERLDHVVSLVSEERLAAIIEAADEGGLWPEVLDLLQHLGAERAGLLGDLAAENDRILDSLALAADAEDLWDSVLPLVPVLSDPGKRRIAAMAARLSQPILERVLTSVCAHDLWSLFIPLAGEHMDDAGRERVAQAVGSVDDATIAAMADAVERDDLWPQLLAVAEQMQPQQLEPLADRLLGTGLEERLPRILEAAERSGLWESGLRLIASMPDSLQLKLACAAKGVPPELRRRALALASEMGIEDQLGRLLPALRAVG